MTCSLARLLVVAGFVGVAVASLTGQDLWGVVAALVAAGAVAALERLGPARRGGCDLPTPRDGADRGDHLHRADRR